MFSSFGNIFSLVRKAQEMGGKMQESNEQLRSLRAHGSAGGGLVSVEVNGLGEMLGLTIDPMLMERQDREMIEDLVPAAVNQAKEKAQQLHAAAMKEMVSDLEMPGLEDALGQFTGGSMAPAPPAEDADTINEQEEFPG
jgi:DNA-binding YbaB/EbfC family protein